MRLQIMFTDYGTHSFDYIVRQMGNHEGEGLPETASPPPVKVHDLQSGTHHRTDD